MTFISHFAKSRCSILILLVAFLFAAYFTAKALLRPTSQDGSVAPSISVSPNRFEAGHDTPFTLIGVGTNWNHSTVPHIVSPTKASIRLFSVHDQRITGVFSPGRQVGEVTLGDNTDSATALASVVEHINSVIVFDGDSLTRGYMGSGDSTVDATRLLVTLSSLRSSSVGFNTGVGGQTIAQMQSRLAANAAVDYEEGKINILLAQGGHNDIGEHRATATQVYSSWKGYIAAAKALHPKWRVVLETELPAGNPGVYPANFDEGRSAANTLLREHWRSLGVCQLADVAADPTIGRDGQEYDERYFNPDRTHPKDAGYVRMGAVDLRAVQAALVGCQE